MFCPHCHNKIPDGSNICPLCYANLAGMRTQSSRESASSGQLSPGQTSSGQTSAHQSASASQARARSKKGAYTKGSRGAKRSADRTPMIIAFGLIVILVVIIAMIIRSMFSVGTPGQQLATAEPKPENTPGGNLVVFGATPEPDTQVVVTPEPEIEITPSPSPTPEVTYTMLRKGDQSRDVETMQKALAQLGYLNGAADGNFGTGTETAVKAFQTANGLNADGIAGKLTLEALYKAANITPAPQTTVDPGDILDLPG